MNKFAGLGCFGFCLVFWLSSIPNPINGQGVVVSVDTIKKTPPMPPVPETTPPEDTTTASPVPVPPHNPGDPPFPLPTPGPVEITELQGNRQGGFRPNRGRIADPFKCRVEDEKCVRSGICCSGNCDSGACKCRPQGSTCDDDFPGHCCSKTCQQKTCCVEEDSDCNSDDECCGKLVCRGRRKQTCRKPGGKNDSD